MIDISQGQPGKKHEDQNERYGPGSHHSIILNPFVLIIQQLLSFAKVTELVFGSLIWGRGGFSLPKLGPIRPRVEPVVLLVRD
jgi:hypothetical protein